MSIGLALSGGGAKGAAHIGVLQALKEANIPIDYISGTSSGSIIATLYTIGYEPFEILKMFNTYCKEIADYDKMLPLKIAGTLFTGKISIKGIAKGERLESILRSFCHAKKVTNINQVQMPLAIPTVDLLTGEVIYYLSKPLNEERMDHMHFYHFNDNATYRNTGDIASIVRASASYPVVFEPKILDQKILIDGGVRVNTPVSILRQMGADTVIAVAFDKNDHCSSYHTNIVTIAMKSFDIMEHQANIEEIERADFVIRPNSEKIGLLDYSKTNSLAREGYQLTKQVIQEIKQLGE